MKNKKSERQMIYLVESFYSFQGEGKYAGTPSVFIRLGECNLMCKGFGATTRSAKNNDLLVGCDSIRAVEKKHFKHTWKKIESHKELINEIEKYLKDKNFTPDIVVTGGEPLLQHDKNTLYKTIKHFVSKKHRITFETNATIEIDFEKYPAYKEVIFAMSVKLSNSGESSSKRIKQKAINNIIKNSKDCFFKFVLDKDIIKNKKAKKEIDKVIKNSLKADVYCMPKGDKAKELEKNDKVVAGFCIKYRYNYIDRMHIRLWNNKEKV